TARVAGEFVCAAIGPQSGREDGEGDREYDEQHAERRGLAARPSPAVRRVPSHHEHAGEEEQARQVACAPLPAAVPSRLAGEIARLQREALVQLVAYQLTERSLVDVRLGDVRRGLRGGLLLAPAAQ